MGGVSGVRLLSRSQWLIVRSFGDRSDVSCSVHVRCVVVCVVVACCGSEKCID